jgi:tetratricopeptide (TPR) repeat protein
MSEVFLSYRQTDDEQKQRVRAFAQRLRAEGITVILDQFFLDDHPEGPHEGWDKWSSDRALHTDYVLIIGTPEWFACFEKRQPPGTGLGAASEADDIRHLIHKAAGVIGHIRVILFDDADAAYIPAKLDRYHRFDAERDFENIIRWLSHKTTVESPRVSIPHNLPSLQPFFGREDELKKIAEALDPESRTWGALINGPGGMGKTSLAVRAAYDASADAFEKIVFISLKSRMLDDDGERDLSSFIISGLAELLNEFARELRHNEIVKAPEDQRPHLLHEALRGTRTLAVLDNLESLVKRERDIIFTFVDKLPLGCKAILTARGRIGSGGKEIILQELSEDAALSTLAKLAENNSALQRTSKAQRLLLYRETGGNPLLLRWTAGQIGRGSSITIEDAIAFLQSCPEGNDPLEFIFGDLVESFNDTETRVLSALTYFSLPATLEHVTELVECSARDVDQALRGVINRSLVVPSEELQTFTLVPLVADFMRKKKPNVVAEIRDRLERHAYAIVVENGLDNYDSLSLLEDKWPIIAAALPCILSGPNDRLQTVCSMLHGFLDFTGRWDESLALSIDAEKRAVAETDFYNAGWQAYDQGWIHYLRGQSAEVLVCALQAGTYWRRAHSDTYERSLAIRLRGLAHERAKDYPRAIKVYRRLLRLWRRLEDESEEAAISLNDLAEAERLSGNFLAAERSFEEALQIASSLDYRDGVATYTGNLARLALDREDWQRAEVLANEALLIAEDIGRQEVIAENCLWLATALLRQNKKIHALPRVRRAVEIFTKLGSPTLIEARQILTQCEAGEQ